MYFFRKILVMVFIGLLVFGLLGIYGGRAGSGYKSAYQQGFIDGQQAAVAGAEGAEGVAPNTSGTNIYYRNHSLFFPGPALLLCLVPLFAFSFMAMKSGRRHGNRGMWGPCGPGRGPWKQGPWEQWEDGLKEKSPDDIDDGPDENISYA